MSLALVLCRCGGRWRTTATGSCGAGDSVGIISTGDALIGGRPWRALGTGARLVLFAGEHGLTRSFVLGSVYLVLSDDPWAFIIIIGIYN